MFWLNKGVHGFRMDAVYTIWETKVENKFPDEKKKDHCPDPNDYGCYDHLYTADTDGTYEVLIKFRQKLDFYSKIFGETRYQPFQFILTKLFCYCMMPPVDNFIITKRPKNNLSTKSWTSLLNLRRKEVEMEKYPPI